MSLQNFLRIRGGQWAALAIVAAYAATALYNAEYITGPDGRPALWTSNAFLISGLVLLSGRWRIACLAGCFAALVLFSYGRTGAFLYALTSGVSAALTSVIGAWLLIRVLRRPRLRNVQQVVKLLCFVATPVALASAVLTAAFLCFGLGRPFEPSELLHSFMATFLGLSLVLPTLLMLATPAVIQPPKRTGLENALLLLAAGVILIAPFTDRYYLALLLTFPLANVFALRLGGKATAVALLFLNGATFCHPFLFNHAVLQIGSSSLSYLIILAFQVCTIVVFYNGLLTALAIDHQARIKRQLVQRTAMARKARAAAMEASRVKTEFLATMSHEVRTPLNSVLGFSQILERRTDLADEARRHLHMIRRSGESLLTIVNDILDFSRVEAGKLELDPQPVHVASLVEDAVAIVGPAAREKGLGISLTTHGDVARHHLADDQRLRQILLNFLNNAVKFTPDGGISVELTIRPRGAEVDAIRIAVADTGIGISPEAQERLFKRFSQADSSISRSYGGTGLGLSICRGLAELMGGRVGVESRVERGSTFWFEVPLPRCDASIDQAVEPDTAMLTAHILLVDDNAANRELGATVLTLLGCTADVACDGAEAIAAAKAVNYDLILMDIHMPRVDGLAATRAIRRLDGPAGLTPIVAMSADVLPAQVERCLAAGMVDSVAKPISVQDLYDCLSRWIGRDANGRERAAA